MSILLVQTLRVSSRRWSFCARGRLTLAQRRVSSRRVQRKVDNRVGAVEVPCCGYCAGSSFVEDSEGVGCLGEGDGARGLGVPM